MTDAEVIDSLLNVLSHAEVVTGRYEACSRQMLFFCQVDEAKKIKKFVDNLLMVRPEFADRVAELRKTHENNFTLYG
jgi:hypothetical protein